MTGRLEPLPPGEWPPAMADALAAIRTPNPRHPFPPRDPDRPKGMNILGLLARHPALATAYHHFIGHVLFGTTLTARQRELLILRVAARRDAHYEWAQHAFLAVAEAGMTEAEVERVRTDPASKEWAPEEAALLAAADQLVDTATVDDATYAALSEHLDIHQVMDAVFTVGAYDLLAMATLAFGLVLDDDLRKWDSH